MDNISIEYRFTVGDVKTEKVLLTIDPNLLELIDFAPPVLPSWAMLEFHQCINCPLRASETLYCPVAANLSGIISKFDGWFSYDTVGLEVITEERTVVQETTVQRAIGSLLGLIFATSGCRHTEFFKPMARFHLPLASHEETVYRATSMYLLSQYFIHQDGGTADLDLVGLSEIYDRIQEVNLSIVHRLRRATRTDSSLNAVVILDVFARTVPLGIDQSLNTLRHLFSAWTRKDA